MDFLRLFPSSSSSTLSANKQSQNVTSQQLLFSAYRNLGLLCYSNGEPNKLHLVSVASAGPPSTAKMLEKPSNSSQPIKTLFKRITTVVLSTKLPKNAQFTNLLVNASGSHATLVGSGMIVVVGLDTDFWQRPPFDGPDCVDHLRSEYYAKSNLLHVSLFVRKFPPAVRCVRWFEPVSDFLEISGSTKMPLLSRLSSLLAILFSDNVIRLYDVSSAVDSPLIQFDFNALLPDRTPDDSAASNGDKFGRGRTHSTLGFITQLVSFDFGPPQSVDGNRTALGSLLALDSNGQLYATLFPFNGTGPCAPPKGPLPLFGFPNSSQHRLLCSALDLLHIRHPFGVQHFSLWAMASEDGLLTHFILPMVLFVGTLTLGGRSAANANVLSPSFELFAIDSVNIGKTLCRHTPRDSKTTTSSMLKAISRLQKMEFCDHCAYLVVGQRDVFRVELTALADHFWHQCTMKSNANTTKAMGEVNSSSNVHQLLMFADSGESPSIGSVVCVQAPIGTHVDDDDDGTDENRQQKQRRDLLFAAECSFGTKMGRKSAFLATLASCLPPSSFSANQQQHQQSTMQKGTKPLLADDVRAFLAQQQAGSAVHCSDCKKMFATPKKYGKHDRACRARHWLTHSKLAAKNADDEWIDEDVFEESDECIPTPFKKRYKLMNFSSGTDNSSTVADGGGAEVAEDDCSELSSDRYHCPSEYMTALTHHSLKLTTEQRNAIAAADAAGGKMGFRHLKNPMYYAYDADIYHWHLHRESAQGCARNYIPLQSDITEAMRSELVDWCVDVVNELVLCPATFFLTVSLTDRTLSRVLCPRDKLQLLGAAAVLIASKMHENFPPTIKDIVHATDDCYTHAQVLWMEMIILKATDFSLGFPLADTFAEFFDYFAPTPLTDVQRHMMWYLLELSTLHYSAVYCHLPSRLAAAAFVIAAAWHPTTTTTTKTPLGETAARHKQNVLSVKQKHKNGDKNATELAPQTPASLSSSTTKEKEGGPFEKWKPMEEKTKILRQELTEPVTTLLKIHQQAWPDTKLNAVRKKYSDVRHNRVARLELPSAFAFKD